MMDLFNVMVGLDMARVREAHFARDAETRRLLRTSRSRREATPTTLADAPPVSRRPARIPPSRATVQDNATDTDPTMQLQGAASIHVEG